MSILQIIPYHCIISLAVFIVLSWSISANSTAMGKQFLSDKKSTKQKIPPEGGTVCFCLFKRCTKPRCTAHMAALIIMAVCCFSESDGSNSRILPTHTDFQRYQSILKEICGEDAAGQHGQKSIQLKLPFSLWYHLAFIVSRSALATYSAFRFPVFRTNCKRKPY